MPSGMKNYDVEVDGVVYTTTTLTEATITGRTPLTEYTIRVRARDNADNESAWSAPITVTTAASGGDTTDPSVPTGVAASNLTQTSFTVSWTASTDNVGVTIYEVEVDGVVIGDTSSSTSRALSGFTAGTDHDVRVRAGDAAGNFSDWTLPETFSTLPPTGGGGTTPLAAYGFDEGSGTTTADEIGTRDLTGLGTTSSWVAVGHSGPGLQQGGSGALLVPSPAGLQTPARTMMMWARRTDTSSGWWCQFNIAGPDTAAWGIGNISSQLYCRCRIGASPTNITATSLPLNEWHHVAITYDGATFRAYLDGVQFGSQPLSGAIDTADTVKVFDVNTNAVQIDDLQFFGAALDATAIQAAMALAV